MVIFKIKYCIINLNNYYYIYSKDIILRSLTLKKIKKSKLISAILQRRKASIVE